MPSTKQVALITLIMVTSALTLSSQLAKAYDPWAFISCNAAGNEKLTFALGENVYGKGGLFSPNREVSIYVIPTRLSPTPSNAMAPPVNVTTDSNGHIPLTCIWTANTIGKYAVWVDANKNGKYEEYSDGFYHFWYCYLFNVVPEYLVGSIGAVAAMIGSFALYRVRSVRRTRKSK
jgi:hypothetical protein